MFSHRTGKPEEHPSVVSVELLLIIPASVSSGTLHTCVKQTCGVFAVFVMVHLCL